MGGASLDTNSVNGEPGKEKQNEKSVIRKVWEERKKREEKRGDLTFKG